MLLHCKGAHWFMLAFAILCEVAGTSIMKMSHSWNFAYGSELGLLIMWLCIGISYYALSKAAIIIPIGVAYALWDSTGLIIITLFSVLFLGEGITLTKALGLMCALSGGWLVHHGTDHKASATEKLEQTKQSQAQKVA